MPQITLLQTKTIEFSGTKDLTRLIEKHREQLGRATMLLDKPYAIPMIQAIAYNLVHLTRELERRNGRRAELRVLHGGKPPSGDPGGG